MLHGINQPSKQPKVLQPTIQQLQMLQGIKEYLTAYNATRDQRSFLTANSVATEYPTATNAAWKQLITTAMNAAGD